MAEQTNRRPIYDSNPYLTLLAISATLELAGDKNSAEIVASNAKWLAEDYAKERQALIEKIEVLYAGLSKFANESNWFEGDEGQICSCFIDPVAYARQVLDKANQ